MESLHYKGRTEAAPEVGTYAMKFNCRNIEKLYNDVKYHIMNIETKFEKMVMLHFI